MRFYKVVVTNDDGSVYAQWSSQKKDGTPDPGALQLEVDIPLATYDSPTGASQIKLYGVGLKTISQSRQFGGKQITVQLGMAKGLPLANPGQQGVAIRGQVQQGYGNWQGVNQSLDLVFVPTTGTNKNPANLTINWKAGQNLSDALAVTLKAAYPQLKTNIQIGSNYVLPNDETGVYRSLEQFATYVFGISGQINKGEGVSMFISDGSINVYDPKNAALKKPKAILFTDLIGQPTWLSLGIVQVHCVMRGDIIISDIVTLPAAQQTFSAASNSQFQNSLSFTGQYRISSVRLVGSSRAPSAENWITVLDMTPVAAT